MDAKFISGLFEGDSSNGVKLGMGLTGGDFWPRVNRCQIVYRSLLPNSIDYNTIIGVFDIGCTLLALSDNSIHQPSAGYLYILHRTSGSGSEESCKCASVKIGFDQSGNLLPTGCNDIRSFRAEQIAPDIIRLGWYYSSFNQQAKCSSFNIYFNNGTGLIDFNEPVLTVLFEGHRFYTADITIAEHAEYIFAVGVVSQNKVETKEGKPAAVSIRNIAPEPADCINAVLI